MASRGVVSLIVLGTLLAVLVMQASGAPALKTKKRNVGQLGRAVEKAVHKVRAAQTPTFKKTQLRRALENTVKTVRSAAKTQTHLKARNFQRSIGAAKNTQLRRALENTVKTVRSAAKTQAHLKARNFQRSIGAAKNTKLRRALENTVKTVRSAAKTQTHLKARNFQRSIGAATKAVKSASALSHKETRSPVLTEEEKRAVVHVIHVCGNYNTQCAAWAYLGECAKNPTYMHSYCGQACHLC